MHRLEQTRVSQRRRLATETEEERQARLTDLTARQRERLAAETEEERQARLADSTARQRERLAVETEKERQARLEERREQQQVSNDIPLLQQKSVQKKMRKFHSHFSTLAIPTCLAYTFTQSLLSVSGAAMTSIYPSSTHWRTTCILDVYHNSYK